MCIYMHLFIYVYEDILQYWGLKLVFALFTAIAVEKQESKTVKSWQ